MEEKERRKWRGLVRDIVGANAYNRHVRAVALWARGLPVPNLTAIDLWERDLLRWDVSSSGQVYSESALNFVAYGVFDVENPERIPVEVTDGIADRIAASHFTVWDASLIMGDWGPLAFEVGFANRVYHAADRRKLFINGLAPYVDPSALEPGLTSEAVHEIEDAALDIAVRAVSEALASAKGSPFGRIRREYGVDEAHLSGAKEVDGVRIAQTLRGMQRYGLEHGRDLLSRYDRDCRDAIRHANLL